MGKKSSSKSVPISLLASLTSACLLSGCASFQSMQSASVNTDTSIHAYGGYLNIDAVGPFYGYLLANKTVEAKAWRDRIIDSRIAIADVHYNDFVRNLSGQRNGFGLTTAVATLGLTSGAAVAAKATSNALSAAATGVTGLGTAYEKQLFVQETIQVLVTQMDANRATILARLIRGEGKAAADYSIGQALQDLSEYEAAGSLQRAIGNAGASADKSKANAQAKVDAAKFAYGYTPISKVIEGIIYPNGWQSDEDLTAAKLIQHCVDAEIPSHPEVENLINGPTGDHPETISEDDKTKVVDCYKKAKAGSKEPAPPAPPSPPQKN